jgi:hypothetical protein
MRAIIRFSAISIAMALALSGCQRQAEPAPAPAPEAAPAPVAEAAPPAWPASLPVFGDGFPQPGDPCRRVGESAETMDFLDHTATLVGCLSADDAVTLVGGRTVATIQGVILVSVPNAEAVPGDGDGQGDAKVAGTPYNATAQIPCAGYQGAAAGLCEAGVVRGTETGTYVEVTLADGRQRTIFFGADGVFLSFATAEADGTAALEISSSREGDSTIAMLGTERYEIPDAFVKGD